MNNKGLTLVELMVSIAIVALLTVLVVPNLSKIRQDSLEKSYQSKIRQINDAAEDWAYENKGSIPNATADYVKGTNTTCDSNCVCILVNELINKGYIPGDEDNKTVLNNPLTEGNMNNMLVCIRYDTTNAINRKIISYVVEE